MNLQLNPQQLLSLYELTVSSLTAPTDVETNASLKEVKQKIHDAIFNVLDEVYSSKNETSFSSWSRREQTKISTLVNDLEKIKTASSQIKQPIHDDDGLFVPRPD